MRSDYALKLPGSEGEKEWHCLWRGQGQGSVAGAIICAVRKRTA